MTDINIPTITANSGIYFSSTADGTLNLCLSDLSLGVENLAKISAFIAGGNIQEHLNESILHLSFSIPGVVENLLEDIEGDLGIGVDLDITATQEDRKKEVREKYKKLRDDLLMAAQLLNEDVVDALIDAELKEFNDHFYGNRS